jgi:hypothetical protein
MVKEKQVNKALVFLMAILALSLCTFADTPSGMGAGSFTRRGIDARPIAMGGAFVAVAEGGSACYYNPAGLGRETRLSAGGMYTEPFGEGLGITFQQVNAAGGFQLQTGSVVRSVGLGVTWLGLTISDIPIWEEEGPGEMFTATNSMYLLSVGTVFPENDNWSVGASLKVYRDKIYEGHSFGVGLDLGILASFLVGEVPLQVGINSMDVGQSKVYWYETAGEPVNYVPWINKLGLSVRLLDDMVLIAGDYDWAVQRPMREQIAHVGLELSPLEEISLRAGWKGDLEQTSSTFTVGVGLYLFDSFNIDYAYASEQVFGVSHLLSVHFSFDI